MSFQPIPDFPNYGVNRQGQICNFTTDKLLRVTYTQRGAPKVGLRKDDKQYWRSVTRLVAEAFASRQNDYHDTPMLIDGDPKNLSADNIVWRPRWFVYEYHEQDEWNGYMASRGPIYDHTTNTQYATVKEFCLTYGLLIRRTYVDIENNKPVTILGHQVSFVVFLERSNK